MDHIQISLNSKENILKIVMQEKIWLLIHMDPVSSINYILYCPHGKKNASEKEQSACIRFNDYEFMHIIILLV